MKFILSSALVVLLHISSSLAQSEPCVTGHSYFDGCNQCTCIGPIYACTEKACISFPQHSEASLPQSTMKKRDVSVDGSEPCVEGHSYLDDCNTCFCSGGRYACTLMGCYHGPQFPDTPTITDTPHTAVEAVKVKRQTRYPEPCAEDHSFNDGCNICSCHKGYHYACTLMACFNVKRLAEALKTINDQSQVKDVNNGIDDMLSAKVKRQAEVALVNPEHCVEGHTYDIECNSCFCTSSGIYACTLRECYHGPQFPDTAVVPSKSKRQVKHSEPCVEGHSYLDDCNTCFCSGGRYACTLMGCYHGPQFPDTPPIAAAPHTAVDAVKVKRQTGYPEPCAEDHSYNDGCNTCSCRKGYHYACTLMACFHVKQLPEAQKPINNQVKDVNNGIDDTLSAKVKRQVEVAPVHSEPCIEGQTYEEDCNTCRCISTGIFVCTRRACYHGQRFPDTVETHTQTKRQTSGCDKGDFYNDGCNSCTCTGDRYACTKRQCYPAPLPVSNPAKRVTREVDNVTGKYDLPKTRNLNHLRFAAERCTPNEVKNEECNRCKCTKCGRGWICTRKVCPTKEQ